MTVDLERALVNFVQTLTLLAEDLHVAFAAEEQGYEASQHLRKAYDAGHEQPAQKRRPKRRRSSDSR